jgi:hypothetical protein
MKNSKDYTKKNIEYSSITPGHSPVTKEQLGSCKKKSTLYYITFYVTIQLQNKAKKKKRQVCYALAQYTIHGLSIGYSYMVIKKMFGLC